MDGKRIVIDALGLPRQGGTQRLVTQLLAAVHELHTQNHYTLYLSRPEPALKSCDKFDVRIIPIRNRLWLRLWAQTYFPRTLRRSRPDIFHAIKNQGIVGVPCRYYVSIFDLTHVKLANIYPLADRLYWRYGLPLILRSVDSVMTISQTVGHELTAQYHWPASKTQVIYPGVASIFSPRALDSEAPTIQARFHLSAPLILYVGGWGTHKNLPTLLHAFASGNKNYPHDLIIVGGAHHTTSEIRLQQLANDLGISARVHFLDEVSDADLAAIYRLSDLFVLPSLNEGFGLSLVEAMASGVPVIAAQRGAIPEVCGDAGVLIDNPTDVSAWASAIEAVLGDPARQAQMKQRGLLRASRYTWQQAAHDLMAWYDDAR